MRNCSCIFAKQSDGEESVLFESSRVIPFFWLLLMDSDDIRILGEKLKQAALSAHSHPDTSVGLNKLKALIRAADRRNYVKQYYPVCLSLYDDWLYFMQISDFSDMKIYLDLYETSLNHRTPEHFIESMQKAVAGFDENREAWYEATIAGTCGREGRNNNKRRLENMSQAFRNMSRQDLYGHFENRNRLRKRRFSFKAKRVVPIIAALIVVALAAAYFYFR
ncbi:MAG: hypothetical protein LBP64_05815 [Tannerella sp.]|jgi:hypothetical protein|nr:hypothetical protein [Tannerella sp.]